MRMRGWGATTVRLMPKHEADAGRQTIEPGELYEDCAYHPCLCVAVEGKEITGISLIDGSSPRACDLDLCGVRRLTPAEAWQWKQSGPPGIDLP
jgi:hypothetical protein